MEKYVIPFVSWVCCTFDVEIIGCVKSHQIWTIPMANMKHFLPIGKYGKPMQVKKKYQAVELMMHGSIRQ